MNQLENCQARYRSNTWMGWTRTDGPDEFEPSKFDCMNMFARFDENPAMSLQVIKKQNVTDGRTDARTDARTDVKTVYPTTNKVCGGYNNNKILAMDYVLDSLEFLF